MNKRWTLWALWLFFEVFSLFAIGLKAGPIIVSAGAFLSLAFGLSFAIEVTR